MKKFSLIFLIASLLCISVCSCVARSGEENNGQLEALESQIAVLNAADSERSERIQSLLDQIAELEKQTSDSPSTQPQSDTAEVEKVGFTYTVSDGKATVTGYVGTDTVLVIPASIDGYKVVSVGDSAFADTRLEIVIISDGVESIGWFAFDGCVKLKSITVPSSVTSIGYSAFGTAESATTILCHSDSFALKYAKSYGLTYTVI